MKRNTLRIQNATGRALGFLLNGKHVLSSAEDYKEAVDVVRGRSNPAEHSHLRQAEGQLSLDIDVPTDKQ